MGFNWENVISFFLCNIGINIYEYCMIYKMFEFVVGSGQCFDIYICIYVIFNVLYYIILLVLYLDIQYIYVFKFIYFYNRQYIDIVESGY